MKVEVSEYVTYKYLVDGSRSGHDHGLYPLTDPTRAGNRSVPSVNSSLR